MTDRRRSQPGTRPQTPAHAWALLRSGNARFMAGESDHPHQNAHARLRLSAKQAPYAILFGCGDSRVAAEIIFDQGLGDLFVIRTAGHVVDSAVLGSLEFGVEHLGIPLIVVLGHDSCGAVRAAVDAVDTGVLPGGFVRDIVERVTPSVLAARRAGADTIEGIEREHIRQTATLLHERSSRIRDAVNAGRLGIIGAGYDLAVGEARFVTAIGAVHDTAAPDRGH